MPVRPKKHKTTSDRHNFMQFQVTRRQRANEYLTKPLYTMHIFHFHAIVNVSDISFLLTMPFSALASVQEKWKKEEIQNKINGWKYFCAHQQQRQPYCLGMSLVCNILKLFSYERHNFASHIAYYAAKYINRSARDCRVVFHQMCVRIKINARQKQFLSLFFISLFLLMANLTLSLHFLDDHNN